MRVLMLALLACSPSNELVWTVTAPEGTVHAAASVDEGQDCDPTAEACGVLALAGDTVSATVGVGGGDWSGLWGSPTANEWGVEVDVGGAFHQEHDHYELDEDTCRVAFSSSCTGGALEVDLAGEMPLPEGC